MNNLKEITEQVYMSTAYSSEEKPFDIDLVHTTDGFTSKGTYIFFDYLTEEEEIFASQNTTQSAYAQRFEEFTEEIGCWASFQEWFATFSKSNKAEVHDAVMEADEWLHEFLSYEIATPNTLKLVQKFKAWQNIILTQALLSQSTPLKCLSTKNTQFKI